MAVSTFPNSAETNLKDVFLFVFLIFALFVSVSLPGSFDVFISPSLSGLSGLSLSSLSRSLFFPPPLFLIFDVFQHFSSLLVPPCLVLMI